MARVFRGFSKPGPASNKKEDGPKETKTGSKPKKTDGPKKDV